MIDEDPDDMDVQLDRLLARDVTIGALALEQALSLAQQFNRHVVRNGHARGQFPNLKIARSVKQSGLSWRGRAVS